MVVDIDRFDAVNRRFGHAAGDSLLRLVGGRIRRQLRETDTAARLGADRFALIVEELARPEHAGTVARKLLAAVAAPVAIAGETTTVTASAGAALFPRTPPTPTAAGPGGGRARRGEARGRASLPAPHDRHRPSPAGDAALAMALEQAIAPMSSCCCSSRRSPCARPMLGLAAWCAGSTGLPAASSTSGSAPWRRPRRSPSR